jgi:putative ABC transport system permease protein
MYDILKDLRYAIRQLRRKPGFAIVVVLTLALGIGANSAIFSVVDGVLLRSLPYEDPDRLVVLWGDETGLRSGSSWASYPDFLDFEEQATSFERLAGSSNETYTLTAYGGEPVRVPLGRVTYDLFSVLGITPVLGRTFLAEEDQIDGPDILMLTHSFWTDRMGADPEVLGRSLVLDGRAFEIVGVMPRGFEWGPAEVFAPLEPQYGADSRGAHRVFTIARLKQGVPFEQADAEVGTIATRLAEAYPEFNTNRGAYLEPLHELTVGDVRSTLWAVFGMVGLVLLIACANVANILLTRSTERRQEVAVRSALGAERRHIVRQLGTESLLLAVIGGVFGIGLAAAGLELLQAFAPAGIPRLETVGLNGRVLAFAALLTMVTGVVFGLLPSLQAARVNLQSRLKEGGRYAAGRRRTHLSQGVIVFEVALAVVAVVSAGLLVNSFLRLQRVDAGFTAENVLVVPIALPAGEYWNQGDPDGERVVAFFDEAEQSIEALPGVTSVASAYMHPLSGGWESSFVIRGVFEPPQGERPEARLRPVTPGYFRTIGTRLLKGRDISATDRADAPGVVVVNESFERTFFPNGDALGHTVVRGAWWRDLPGEFEIVGVVSDVKMDGYTESVPTALYFSHPQFPFADMNLVIGTSVDPATLLTAIQERIWAIDSNLPIEGVETLTQIRSAEVAPEQFRTILVGLFAAVALLLSAIGIYGVLSYSVAQRTREVGLRMSLGARAPDVLRLVIRQGMGLALAGLLAGGFLSFLATGLLQNLLFEVSPTDPVTFAVVAALLAAVALLACIIPAIRATRVDPLVALRAE